MDKPDKIFVCPDDELWIAGAWDRAPDSLPDEATYLLATPERGMASELVEALRGLIAHVEVTEEWMDANGYDGGPDRRAIEDPRAVLAKLEREK